MVLPAPLAVAIAWPREIGGMLGLFWVSETPRSHGVAPVGDREPRRAPPPEPDEPAVLVREAG